MPFKLAVLLKTDYDAKIRVFVAKIPSISSTALTAVENNFSSNFKMITVLREKIVAWESKKLSN